MMQKKRAVTNRLYGANGGWAAVRSVQFDGTAHVYGEPYSQVSPIVSAQEWQDMLAWCVETFGPSGTEEKPGVWSRDQRWYANNARFLFRNDQDRDWFLLRWQ